MNEKYVYTILISNGEKYECYDKNLYKTFYSLEEANKEKERIKNLKGQEFYDFFVDFVCDITEMDSARLENNEKEYISDYIDILIEKSLIDDIPNINNREVKENKKTIEEIKIADAIQKLMNGKIEMEQLFYQYDRKFEPISNIVIFGEDIQLTDSQDYEITTINKNDIIYIIK